MKVMTIAVLLAAVSPAHAEDFPRWEAYGGFSLARVQTTTDTFTFVEPGGGATTYHDLCSSDLTPVLGANFQSFYCDGRNFPGFEASLTHNFDRHFGIQLDVTGHFKDETFVDDFSPATVTIDTSEQLWSALLGVQWKQNSTAARLKPFVRALAGVVRYKGRGIQDIDIAPEFNFDADDRVTSFAAKLGAGLDLRLSPHIDLRLIGVDYAPVFAGDRDYHARSGPFTFSSTGKTAHNFTASWGIAVH